MRSRVWYSRVIGPLTTRTTSAGSRRSLPPFTEQVQARVVAAAAGGEDRPRRLKDVLLLEAFDPKPRLRDPLGLVGGGVGVGDPDELRPAASYSLRRLVGREAEGA